MRGMEGLGGGRWRWRGRWMNCRGGWRRHARIMGSCWIGRGMGRVQLLLVEDPNNSNTNTTKFPLSYRPYTEISRDMEPHQQHQLRVKPKPNPISQPRGFANFNKPSGNQPSQHLYPFLHTHHYRGPPCHHPPPTPPRSQGKWE